MRKGMLFFSQYRTPRVIFLKNLKKYLRFVSPCRRGASFLQAAGRSAHGLAPALQQRGWTKSFPAAGFRVSRVERGGRSYRTEPDNGLLLKFNRRFRLAGMDD